MTPSGTPKLVGQRGVFEFHSCDPDMSYLKSLSLQLYQVTLSFKIQVIMSPSLCVWERAEKLIEGW